MYTKMHARFKTTVYLTAANINNISQFLANICHIFMEQPSDSSTTCRIYWKLSFTTSCDSLQECWLP